MCRFALVAVALALLSGARAEWVEIPQFSDRGKVYKLPPIQFPQSDGLEGSTFHKGLRNVSGVFDSPRPVEPLFDATIVSFTTERTVSTVGVVQDPESAEDATEEVGGQMSHFDSPPSADDTGQSDGADSSETITKASIPNTSESNQTFNKTDNDKGFLDYLPVDLLKRVHKTLKSQPPNLIGKIRFLKMFEKTLLEEIKSRISHALAPTRIPREAREHDEGLGFPSLEGALMAISFLTFAVYLVRLVMLLFRNANNNTAGASILIGRKKRSIDHMDEETARILSYLDTPLPLQY